MRGGIGGGMDGGDDDDDDEPAAISFVTGRRDDTNDCNGPRRTT